MRPLTDWRKLKRGKKRGEYRFCSVSGLLRDPGGSHFLRELKADAKANGARVDIEGNQIVIRW